MKKLDILNGVSRTFHKIGFKVEKHSPEILLAAGVVGVVASAVVACRATLKVEEITTETSKKVEKIHTAAEKGQTESGAAYSAEDRKKDLAIVYARTGLEFVKLYGPSILLGGASIGCILASNNIMRKRNIALAAAYATVDSSFKNYRARLIDRFGKELDRELKYGIKAKEVEEIVVDEKGEQQVVKKTIEVVENPCECSPYARFFDETCLGWEKNAEYNLMFLKQMQAHANDKLRAQGQLTLNEVYDMLGMQRSQAGMVVGWVYGGDGDNYVDFGIYNVHDEQKRNFVNGYERSILLDFNVDGNIYDLMK